MESGREWKGMEDSVGGGVGESGRDWEVKLSQWFGWERRPGKSSGSSVN